MRRSALLPLLALLAVGTPARAQHRPAPAPWSQAPAEPLLPPAWRAAEVSQEPEEISGARYTGMLVGGTLGSALGLIGGVIGSVVLHVGSGGCIDCGKEFNALDYALLGAGSSLGTAFFVTGVADNTEPYGFWATVAEMARSPRFGPALLGAVAGIGTGAVLGTVVDRVAPEGEPYGLLGYSVGQAAASVVAVRIAEGARKRSRGP